MLEAFLGGFRAATEHIAELRRGISRDVEVGVRWAEALMNRHLAYAASGSTSEFDPSELAHALRGVVVCVSDRNVRFELILTALNAICAAQRPDGSWACQQPFYWTKTGSTVSTLSIEAAGAIVATVNALQQNPERYGASPEQCLAGLQEVFRALDRFFQWLSANIQSFPLPPALQPTHNIRTLYGWCSDRAPEQGRIHSWVTAAAIEFLVEFRRLQEERINALLRAKFLSHHPDELKTLANVAPTDLDRKERVIFQVAKELREHKKLALREGPWLAETPRKAEISLWSMIFYGPPGTSKTFLAEAIAGEMRWPLISLSPSDFLTAGEQHIEARAKEIFSALSAGSHLVYFFDEIDELIRDRRYSQNEQRSVFSFLTPSFLTKLQELRKAAKKQEFIFILGTNYFDRIDSAAKRTGRVDREFALVYPDLTSREELLLRYIMEKIGPREGKPVEEGHLQKLSEKFTKLQVAWSKELQKVRTKEQNHPQSGDTHFIEVLTKFTGFLAYPKIRELLDARLRILLDEDDNAGTFDPLVKDLSEVAHGKSIRFKPEIKLSDYWDRPDALEEIKLVLDVFPKDPPPWPPRDADNQQRRVQLKGLIERAKDSFKTDLEQLR
jgi:hypothetical protein